MKCLQVMEEVDLGLKILANINLTIVEFIIVAIKVVTMVEVDIGLKRPATIPLAIVDQELMLIGEMDLGIIPENIPPITQVGMEDFGVSHFILFQLNLF